MQSIVIIDILEKIKAELSLEREGVTYIGICKVAFELRMSNEITEFQHDFIYDYLLANKPTPKNKYKAFTESPYWTKNLSQFWWDTITSKPETRQIRLDYLTALINDIK